MYKKEKNDTFLVYEKYSFSIINCAIGVLGSQGTEETIHFLKLCRGIRITYV
jgi:hypothetical protein